MPSNVKKNTNRDRITTDKFDDQKATEFMGTTTTITFRVLAGVVNARAYMF